MLRVILASVVSTALASGVVYHVVSDRPDIRVGMSDPHHIALLPAPIRPDWILEGHPEAKSRTIGQTHDGTTHLIVWSVTAGRFNWFYDFDETVTILDGDVYLTDGANARPGNPAERHLGPGDVVFFHNGSTATWRVPDHVRKIATVRYPLPTLVAGFYNFARTVKSFVTPAAASGPEL
jgi:uncharacterized cupin superfamily protein